VTGDDRELRLESISSRFIGGRSLALTGQPVEEVELSSALPGCQHDGNDTYYIEQAYVQRFVPVGRVRDEPALLVPAGRSRRFRQVPVTADRDWRLHRAITDVGAPDRRHAAALRAAAGRGRAGGRA
jgi:hypothetical protein